MLSKLIFVAIFAIILLCAFDPEDVADITYVKFKTPLLDIQYSKQGLLCNGIYKNKYRVDFIRMRNLDLKKVHALNDFITRNNFWSMGSSFVRVDGILDDNGPLMFILNKEHTEEYKVISYQNCYNSVLDSLMIYLNDIIPTSKRKYYNISTYRYLKERGDCIPNKP